MAKLQAEFEVKLDASVTQNFKKIKKTLDKTEAQIKDINSKKVKINVDDKGMKKAGESLGDFNGKMEDMVGDVPIVGDSLKQLATSFGPVGLAVAAVSAVLIGAGIALFSVAGEIREVDKQLKRFIDNTDDLEKANINIRAIQDTFDDIDTKELSDAAKVLSKEFGITGAKAVDLVNQSLIATGGSMDLDQIKEYATQFKSMGATAESFVGTVTQGNLEGFYNDKFPDALKESRLRLAELTKGQGDILKKIGLDPVQLKKDLKSGTLSFEDATRQIAVKAKDLDQVTKTEVLANIFGGAGEDAGVRLLDVLAKGNVSLSDMVDKNKEQNSIFKDNLKLAEAQDKASRKLIPIIKAFEKIWTQVQTVLFDIGDGLSDIILSIFQLFKTIEPIFFNVKLTIGIILLQLKGMMKLIAFGINLFTGLVNIIKFGLLKAFEKVKEVIKSVLGETIVNSIKESWTKFFDFITKRFAFLQSAISKTVAMAKALADNRLVDAGKLAKEAAIQFKAVITGKGLEIPKTEAEKEAEKKGITPTADGTKALDKKVDENAKNQVKGATSNVRNITLNLDALQNIEKQIINEGGDVDNIQSMLQQALLQVLNDTNQAASI